MRRVRIRPSAPHVFPVFRGQEATVLDTRTFGTPRRRWLWLEVEGGRRTWLPEERVEPLEDGP